MLCYAKLTLTRLAARAATSSDEARTRPTNWPTCDVALALVANTSYAPMLLEPPMSAMSLAETKAETPAMPSAADASIDETVLPTSPGPTVAGAPKSVPAGRGRSPVYCTSPAACSPPSSLAIGSPTGFSRGKEAGGGEKGGRRGGPHVGVSGGPCDRAAAHGEQRLGGAHSRDAAAAAEGGLNPFADIAALAVGIAGLFGANAPDPDKTVAYKALNPTIQHGI